MAKTKVPSRRLNIKSTNPHVARVNEKLMSGAYLGLQAGTSTSTELMLKKILSILEPKHGEAEASTTILGANTILRPREASPQGGASPSITLDGFLSTLGHALHRSRALAESFGYFANRLGAENPFDQPAPPQSNSDSNAKSSFLPMAWDLLQLLHFSLDQLDRDLRVMHELEGNKPDAVAIPSVPLR